jgi:hypothetical protein
LQGSNLAHAQKGGEFRPVNGQIQYVRARAMTSEPTPAPDSVDSSRLGIFRRELRTIGSQATRADLQRLLQRARELDLREEDVQEELDELRMSLEAIDFADRIAREGLPVITSSKPLPPEDRCHFFTPVRFGRRRSDQIGHLELTTGWVKFHGALDLSVVWTEVSAVERKGHDIIVALVDSRRVLRFSCHALEEAARGAVVAQHLAFGTASQAPRSNPGCQSAL